ncbi:MAG: hypothetical protein A2W61_02345 [Deltaproteobacteria bacterium RIFCSPLOWO2_01_44_7]|nr:MAG: hypothetical protein A2W61_02345 [Deltaproteobacteria bacterium RIFCSPLOWO2_01_44_7]
MSVLKTMQTKLAALGIFAFCFGYFASYVPYSMMTKMITSGLFEGMSGKHFSGFEILPAVGTATFIAMYVYLTLSGWWKHSTHSTILGVSIPRPRWITFISGLCTAGVIITTTLSYALEGISIVFAMLLMRGATLVIAPIVDLIAVKRKRKIYWPSWAAAALSLAALFITFSGRAGTTLTLVAIINIACYLLSYFLRFFFMSNWAKSTDAAEKKRFFTEEQMVANPVFWGAIMITGLIGSQMDPASIPGQVWQGMTTFLSSGYVIHAFLVGIFSYGTGLFGTLIFLDPRENTFTVPASRVSSVIAGVVATYALAIFYGSKYPPTSELTGLALLIVAILFLSYHSIVEKKKRAHYDPRALEKEAEEVHHPHILKAQAEKAG